MVMTNKAKYINPTNILKNVGRFLSLKPLREELIQCFLIVPWYRAIDGHVLQRLRILDNDVTKSYVSCSVRRCRLHGHCSVFFFQHLHIGRHKPIHETRKSILGGDGTRQTADGNLVLTS